MHAEQPYCKFGSGFIKGTCSPVSSVWYERLFPGWNADWTTSAYKQIPSTELHYSDSSSSSSSSSAKEALEGFCDEWVENPTLIVQRDTFANFFHDSEDFFNVFIALAILKWNRADTQIMLTDLYPKGPFW